MLLLLVVDAAVEDVRCFFLDWILAAEFYHDAAHLLAGCSCCWLIFIIQEEDAAAEAVDEDAPLPPEDEV